MVSDNLIGEVVVEFKQDDAGQMTNRIEDLWLVIGMKLSEDGEQLITMNAWTSDHKILLNEILDGRKYMLRKPSLTRLFSSGIPVMDLDEVREEEGAENGEGNDRKE